MKGTVALEDARPIAHDLLVALTSAAARIEIAGSIRRRKATVGDIELVATPLMGTRMTDSLFPEPITYNVLGARLDELLAAGVLAAHPDDPKRGERYAKLVHASSGMQLDLFMPAREAFGLIYLIRTGPADYSQRFVTDMKHGHPAHHVAGGRLHVGTQCWGNGCEVLVTAEEQDVYDAVGWPFIEPELRA